jgi:hypothetical protein
MRQVMLDKIIIIVVIILLCFSCASKKNNKKNQLFLGSKTPMRNDFALENE